MKLFWPALAFLILAALLIVRPWRSSVEFIRDIAIATACWLVGLAIDTLGKHMLDTERRN